MQSTLRLGLETFGFFMTAPLTVPVEKRHIIYRFWNTCFMLCSNQNSTGNEVIYIYFTLSPLHAPPSIQYFESGLNTKGNSGKHRIDKHIFLSWKPVAARVFFRCLSQRVFFCVLLNIYHFDFRPFFYLLIARLISN